MVVGATLQKEVNDVRSGLSFSRQSSVSILYPDKIHNKGSSCSYILASASRLGYGCRCSQLLVTSPSLWAPADHISTNACEMRPSTDGATRIACYCASCAHKFRLISKGLCAIFSLVNGPRKAWLCSNFTFLFQRLVRDWPNYWPSTEGRRIPAPKSPHT